MFHVEHSAIISQRISLDFGESARILRRSFCIFYNSNQSLLLAVKRIFKFGIYMTAQLFSRFTEPLSLRIILSAFHCNQFSANFQKTD